METANEYPSSETLTDNFPDEIPGGIKIATERRFVVVPGSTHLNT